MEILCFGIVKEITGASHLQYPISGKSNVEDLKHWIIQQYPELGTLSSLVFAVNNEYAQANQIISEEDEVAIIPPVSGG